MNKKQEDILKKVFTKYVDSHWSPPSNPGGPLLIDNLSSLKPMQHSKESFINKIKTDNEFAKQWGVVYQERELSLQERYQLLRANGVCPKYTFEIEDEKPIPNKLSETEWYDKYNIPKRAITITYNNKTIESYEFI
jgi:hypothetical protein